MKQCIDMSRGFHLSGCPDKLLYTKTENTWRYCLAGNSNSPAIVKYFRDIPRADLFLNFTKNQSEERRLWIVYRYNSGYARKREQLSLPSCWCHEISLTSVLLMSSLISVSLKLFHSNSGFRYINIFFYLSEIRVWDHRFVKDGYLID